MRHKIKMGILDFSDLIKAKKQWTGIRAGALAGLAVQRSFSDLCINLGDLCKEAA